MTRAPFDPATISVGDDLPTWVLDVTATRIVAGAIATRDFMPVHHDRDYANQQGAADIFANILSDTAWCSRFLTDWAGPNAMVRRLAIRLGVPLHPGHTLTFTGQVASVTSADASTLLEIAFSATNEMGEHVGGTATIDVPNAS
jgi:acyl dehydratase